MTNDNFQHCPIWNKQVDEPLCIFTIQTYYFFDNTSVSATWMAAIVAGQVWVSLVLHYIIFRLVWSKIQETILSSYCSPTTWFDQESWGRVQIFKIMKMLFWSSTFLFIHFDHFMLMELKLIWGRPPVWPPD